MYLWKGHSVTLSPHEKWELALGKGSFALKVVLGDHRLWSTGIGESVQVHSEGLLRVITGCGLWAWENEHQALRVFSFHTEPSPHHECTTEGV